MTFQPSNLRPLKAGEILDRAFRLYRANFWLFILAASIFLAPFLVLELLCIFVLQNTTFLFLLELFFILNINIVNGAMCWIASCAYLGIPISINDAYRRVLHSFGDLFTANLRLGLIYASSLIVGLAGLFILSVPFLLLASAMKETIYQEFFLAFALLPIVLYPIFWSTRWMLVVPIIMIDNLGTRDALTRSWSLTARDFWRILVVLIGLHLFSYLTILLAGIVIQYALMQFSLTNFVSPMLWSVFMQLGLLLGIPLSGSILVILYYDVCVRHEGYDLLFALDISDKEHKSDAEQ